MQPTEFLEQVFFVLTVYRLPPGETPAWSSLVTSLSMANQHADLLVYDNSPQEGPIPASDHVTLHYYHNAGNAGVSAAYNHGYQIASTKGKKWLMLLDQDVTMPLDFVEHFAARLSAYPASSLFCPRVCDGRGILSPFRWRFGGGERITSFPSQLPLDRYRVINSGMVISCDAFSATGGYDETISLDFSDIAFLEKFRRVYPFACMVDIDFVQEHSSAGSDKRERIERFKIYCLGAKYFSKQCDEALTLWLRSLVRAVKQTIAYGDLDFIRIHFKIWSG